MIVTQVLRLGIAVCCIFLKFNIADFYILLKFNKTEDVYPLDYNYVIKLLLNLMWIKDKNFIRNKL